MATGYPAMFCSKNEEDWQLKEEEDTGMTRTMFKAAGCPDPNNCSANAWKNARAWSFESDTMVYAYVTYHLHVGKHKMTEDDAFALAAQTEIVTEQETYVDRDRYRKEARACQAAQEALRIPQHPKYPPPPGRPRERVARTPSRSRSRRNTRRSPRRSPRRHSPPRPRGGPAIGSPAAPASLVGPTGELTTAVRTLTSVISKAGSLSSAASSSAAGGTLMLATNDATVEMPTGCLRLLHASLRQMRESAENIAKLLPVIAAAETTIGAQLATFQRN